MRSVLARAATGFAAAVCAVAVVAPAAVADPPAGVVPAATDLVGVGVDTTQAFMNRTSVDYNAAVMAGLPRLYSWDVTGLNPITPKAGALSINRPDGSGPGFTALINTTISALDFSRSSRAASPGDPKSYSFVPFAKDAVSWSAKAGGHAPADLSGAQLRAIYECTATNWLQIDPSLANATIKPYLPPSSSDTRVAFLKALGGGTAIVPGACVTAGPRNDRGTDPALDDIDVVFPYSVGVYIDQVYRGHGTAVESPGPLTVRGINGVPPVDAAQNINAPFLGSHYGRLLWHIFRSAEYTGANAHGVALRSVFGPQGWICAHPAVIVAYGFVPIANCGSITNT
ncbi:substrate-binding domain-containing protein [Kitasatospora purpeofusca]|uniref:substrate-binding domain-containing protein n=1 Tax=Kitasatospora purpeofusca TaxID=67352 RepID=UPI00224DC874|nr:substrate-binding domain-containing protein [Kitasatospora purpeofusca]MCX4690184.1 substrate-binding domain-containing protein [Kitasatospora purpeofusca]